MHMSIGCFCVYFFPDNPVACLQIYLVLCLIYIPPRPYDPKHVNIYNGKIKKDKNKLLFYHRQSTYMPRFTN